MPEIQPTMPPFGGMFFLPSIEEVWGRKCAFGQNVHRVWESAYRHLSSFMHEFRAA